MDALVKRTLLVLLLLLPGLLQAAPWTDHQAPILSTSVGFAPIYIEEITEAGRLTTGATVLPLHGRVRYGWPLRTPAVVQISADSTVYTDADGHFYLSSLLAGGVELVLEDTGQTRFSIGVGYADKRVFGADLSTSGWGLQLGMTQPVTGRFAVEVGYLYRQFTPVASLLGDGEQEHSSLLMLGLSYRWQ